MSDSPVTIMPGLLKGEVVDYIEVNGERIGTLLPGLNSADHKHKIAGLVYYDDEDLYDEHAVSEIRREERDEFSRAVQRFLEKLQGDGEISAEAKTKIEERLKRYEMGDY